MQTFLPESNFETTAKNLDRKRLIKQSVENLQILKSLSREDCLKKILNITGSIKTILTIKNLDILVVKNVITIGQLLVMPLWNRKY